MNSIELTVLVFCPVLAGSLPLAQVAGGNSDPTTGGPVCWLDEGGALTDTFLWPPKDPTQIGNGKHNTLRCVGYRRQCQNTEYAPFCFSLTTYHTDRGAEDSVQVVISCQLSSIEKE